MTYTILIQFLITFVLFNESMKNTLFLISFLLLFKITYSQTTASKQVSTFEIEVPQLSTQKTVWVYLPKTYQKHTKDYPVIYMFDAQNLFDAETSYVGEWKIDEYMDTLSKGESIVIAIEHGNEKRIEELTPYTHESYGGGKGKDFLEFIVHTLKPHVDQTYRTKPDASSTTIIGSSLGGLMAFYAAITYSDTFGQAGVFSPAFWINPEIYELAENASIPKTSRFYFLVGTNEGESMVPNQERMVKLLQNKGVSNSQIKNYIIEGGQHNEAFWSEHFPDAYQWLIKQD